MKTSGMLVRKFELNCKKRPIWTWLKVYFPPKRYHLKLKRLYYQVLFRCSSGKEPLPAPTSRHRDGRKLRHKTEIRGFLFGALTAERVSFVSIT